MESMEVCGSESNRFQVADGYPTGEVLPVESQGSLSHVAAQQDAGGSGVGLAGHAGEFGVCSEATSGWTRSMFCAVLDHILLGTLRSAEL